MLWLYIILQLCNYLVLIENYILEKVLSICKNQLIRTLQCIAVSYNILLYRDTKAAIYRYIQIVYLEIC